jgi:hypothetical protein
MSARAHLGRRVWAFPDGDLPVPGDSEPHGHESLVLLNPNRAAAEVRLTVYFPGRAPERDLRVVVEAERVRCMRLDRPVGEEGFRIPYGQYALLVESQVPIIAQIGRMDVQQANLAYYTVMGFPVEGENGT